ncbi:hypothetical protein FHX37_4428 [Haloactinospora alba]|uniref:Uncharacterized protein n=1 Tax=Haloactinospora alba TaxID=405555 RepID=A0A543N789_9ACTN|nr:hypothetical protein FHX37_4428 [Haloactinospora alba]
MNSAVITHVTFENALRCSYTLPGEDAAVSATLRQGAGTADGLVTRMGGAPRGVR